jgi:hypothetical protein
MWEFIKIVQLVLQLTPMVIDTLKAVEAAIPGEGKGEQKLAIVRATIEEAYNQFGVYNIAFDKVWTVMTSQIGQIVQTFNDTGVFSKETK